MTHHPDPGVDPQSPLAGVLANDELLVVQNAIINDIENKMTVWSDFATCFFAVDKPGEDQARPISISWETLPMDARESGDFAQRIMGLVTLLWEREFRRIIFIAGTTPSLPVSILRDAMEWLVEKDVIIGPNGRGGLYMLGMRDIEAPFIPPMGMTAPDAFAHSVAGVGDGGYTVQLLDFWPTMDSPADLAQMQLHLGTMLSAHINTGSVQKYNVWDAMARLVEGGGNLIDDPRFKKAEERKMQETVVLPSPTAPQHVHVPRGASPFPGGAPAPLPGAVKVRPAGGPRSAVSNAGGSSKASRADDVG
ncbi:MAG: DUF2064 domain-containing protein [Planctomycetota bacterium]